MNLLYKIAPSQWNADAPNPFADDGQYGNSWSCFSTRGKDTYRYLIGRSKAGCWQLKFGRNNSEYRGRVVDFIGYENRNGRTVILDSEPGNYIEILLREIESEMPGLGTVRESDPKYVLHSTSLEAWDHIKASGELVAAAFLKERWNFDDSDSEAAEYIRNEPPDYKEYVMLGIIGGGFTEIVVASYQTRKMITDENVEYSPGARLYIKNHAIIADGLGVRDGVHTMKVHRRLPLENYLAVVVTRDDVRLEKDEKHWTPKLFAEKADRRFEKLLAGA